MKMLKFDYEMVENSNDIKAEYICRKIKDYFIEIGLNTNDVAKALNVSKSAISNQLSNRSFGINSAKKWSKTFGFNINWLTTGEGPMLDIKKKTLTLNADSIDIKHNCNNHINREIPVIPAKLFKVLNIDILNVISEDKDIETLPAIPHLPEHDFLARCPGGSMEPKIPAGSLIALKYIDNSSKIKNGEMYAINTKSQGIIIRRLTDNKDGTYKCVPLNQDKFITNNIQIGDIVNIFEVVGYLAIG